MKKIIIFGNSGSGKSTLAKHLVKQYGLSHLDLDILAWQDTNPPTRKPLNESAVEINQFVAENQKKDNKGWIIEGCYADLISLIESKANEMVFLNLSVEKCIENCRNRPWEPHKYASKEEQDKNLEMLINWIKQYPVRDDKFSLVSHMKLFDAFKGEKTEYNKNLSYSC